MQEIEMIFDHVGIPTDEKQPSENWVESTHVWVTNPYNHPYRIEFLRFEQNTPCQWDVVHLPHVAYRVKAEDFPKLLEGVERATNLALVQPNPALDLYTDHWPLHTRSEERPAAKIGPQAKVVSSLISNGCVIRGFVSNSVLSPGVYVSPGAMVKDSVIMNDTWIGPGALLDKVVIDKQVVIGAGAVVGQGDEKIVNEQMPDRLSHGITVIGKNARIPDGAQIGRNVLINSNRDEPDFPADKIVADGKTV